MKEIQIAGKLYWQDWELDLLDPHPVLEREHWMKDTDEKFTVVQFGKVFDVIVSRPFMISRKDMGKKVSINVEELQDVESDYSLQKIAEIYSNISN